MKALQPTMLHPILIFLLGLGSLIAGAEALVRGASRLSLTLGLTPLVIGLTVVAFGTSAPELGVSIQASLSGSPGLAIGNVVGSNIANVLLILGVTALVAPLFVKEQIIRQEVPVMIGAATVFLLMAQNGRITQIEAAILLVLVVVYCIYLIRQSRRASKTFVDEYTADVPASRWDRHWSVQLLLIAAGLAMLVQGASWLVSASVVFAQSFGVSDLVIGLTVVALGTSMPEVATSVVAVLRGHRDLAVGNVIGSSIFNILAVVGVTGVITAGGLPVAEAARNFDLWVMVAVAFACLPIMLTDREISRWEGALFVGYYAVYLAYLVFAAQKHALLTPFSDVMIDYVLPLTVITIVVTVLKANDTGKTNNDTGKTKSPVAK